MQVRTLSYPDFSQLDMGRFKAKSEGVEQLDALGDQAKSGTPRDADQFALGMDVEDR